MLRANHKSKTIPPQTNGRVSTQANSRLLAQAAADGDLARVRELKALGADVNYKNRDGETPLAFAAAWNQLDAAKLLLSLGANPNIPDKIGGTALMLAVQHGSKDLVDLLLQHGADVNAIDGAGNTVLNHADWRDDSHRTAVRKLILKR